VKHTHVPSDCARPWLLHVALFEYWQSEPVKPETHEHAPPMHVPTPLHGTGSLELHADASAGVSHVAAKSASAVSAVTKGTRNRSRLPRGNEAFASMLPPGKHG
jgi:hypothetical protein